MNRIFLISLITFFTFSFNAFSSYDPSAVTSPGSSKVVLCSAKVSSTGVISSQVGGCFASCTNETAPVCTFTTGYWKTGEVPNCWFQTLSGFSGNVYILSNTQVSANILDSAGTGLSGSREYFCHGIKN